MRLFRRTHVTTAPPDERTADQIAVERYDHLLRTAPPDTIETMHAEAFEQLTPKQVDILFERLSEDSATPAERPQDAQPATLARAATRAEARGRGTMSRRLGPGRGSATSPYVGAV